MVVTTCELLGCNAPGHPFVCVSHEVSTHDAIVGMPMHYVRLAGALVPSRGSQEHVSGSREAQAPLSVPALTLMGEMAAHVQSWGNLARRQRGVGPMKAQRGGATREGTRLVRGVEALLRHDRMLYDLPLACQYALSTSRLRKRAEVLLSEDTLIHRLPAPCPVCDMMTLIRRDGDEYVICASCATTWSADEYRRLVHVLAYMIESTRHQA